MKRLLPFAFALGLMACGSEKADVLTPILGSGHFRGNTIGDKYDKVLKQVANDNIVVNDGFNINCETQVDAAEVSVRYEFDDEELYSIQADIFLPDTSALRVFQTDLVESYNERFGAMTEESGFLVWRDRTRSGSEVELTLADESIEFGRPMLSLTIYNFDL